jgi:MFS family permease
LGYIAVIAVIAFVISFAIALGPVPFLLIGEIFPSSCRAYAMSIAIAVNWLCNFIVALTFPQLNEALGSYAFFPFTAVILIALIFTILLVPETKGKSIEEITGLSD